MEWGKINDTELMQFKIKSEIDEKCFGNFHKASPSYMINEN